MSPRFPVAYTLAWCEHAPRALEPRQRSGFRAPEPRQGSGLMPSGPCYCLDSFLGSGFRIRNHRAQAACNTGLGLTMRDSGLRNDFGIRDSGLRKGSGSGFEFEEWV